MANVESYIVLYVCIYHRIPSPFLLPLPPPLHYGKRVPIICCSIPYSLDPLPPCAVALLGSTLLADVFPVMSALLRTAAISLRI